jgi:hypothetical protein
MSTIGITVAVAINAAFLRTKNSDCFLDLVFGIWYLVFGVAPTVLYIVHTTVQYCMLLCSRGVLLEGQAVGGSSRIVEWCQPDKIDSAGLRALLSAVDCYAQSTNTRCLFVFELAIPGMARGV